jgi:hypothetical protein
MKIYDADLKLKTNQPGIRIHFAGPPIKRMSPRTIRLYRLGMILLAAALAVMAARYRH